MAFIKPEQWAKYEKILNDFQEDAFQQDVVWRSEVVTNNVHGEDSNRRNVEITIKGLVQYNYFRSWPINAITPAGEIDKESCLLFLNVKYLKDNGWANSEGQFLFDSAKDKFIINGREYKPMGDSQAAQANDKPIFVFIILKREEGTTGGNKLNM